MFFFQNSHKDDLVSNPESLSYLIFTTKLQNQLQQAQAQFQEEREPVVRSLRKKKRQNSKQSSVEKE